MRIHVKMWYDLNYNIECLFHLVVPKHIFPFRLFCTKQKQKQSKNFMEAISQH